MTGLLYAAPSLVLENASSLTAFGAEQLRALALVFLKLNASALDVHLVFFGLWCALVGYLIFRSTFLPRALGVLVAISGVGWMVFLLPPLAHRLFIPYIAAASAVGEIPLEFWLLVFAVNADRWKEQAGRAA